MSRLSIAGAFGCLLTLAPFASASEARVAFALKSGWVEFALRHDDKPVADAVIQIMDEKGVKFAEGESGPDGQGAFPMPRGSSCVVEIKIGERTADPIRLYATPGGAIEPARVLLSYGLRPCCRSLKKDSPAETKPKTPPVDEEPASAPPSGSNWSYIAAIGGLAGVAMLVIGTLVIRRRSIFGGATPGSSARFVGPLTVLGCLCAALGAYYIYHKSTATSSEQPRRRDLAREARDDLERRKFRPLSMPLDALLADASETVPTQAHTHLLQPTPDFTLRDIDGHDWSLSAKLKSGPVVAVFYYGYHCDHCVSQLFALDKDIDKFREAGVTVVAISADPPELTRKRFQQYGAFRFPVLSDPGNKIAEKYETYVPPAKDKEGEGDLMHGTFVISRTGVIRWTNRGDSPFTDNGTLLREALRP